MIHSEGGTSFFRRALSIADQSLSYLGTVVLVGIFAVTVVNVLGRYLFNMPFPGSFELLTLLFFVISVVPIGSVQRGHEHIGVEFIRERIESPLKGAVIDLILEVILFAFLSVFTWQGIRFTIDDWHRFSIGPVQWPHWPAIICLPLGFGFCCIVTLHQILGRIKGFREIRAIRRDREQ